MEELMSMSDEARDAFLAEPKIAVLATPSIDGPPLAVPIWFEWTEGRARFFTTSGSPKVRRLAADPTVSLLVANPTGQPEAWVLIEGRAETRSDGAWELAERLADRYWDMADAGHLATVEEWRVAADSLLLVEIEPTRIRSYG
jgi:PPOX class probable F420-dependent enzyme